MLSDTDPRAERVQLNILRDMEPGRKVDLVFQLSRTAKDLAQEGLKHRHPEAKKDELKVLVAQLILGEELANKVYPSR